MKTAVIASTLLAGASAAVLAPKEATPAGCAVSFDSSFEITVAQVTTKKEKRDIQPRSACGSNGALVMTLKDGSTFDSKQRTGYIASNYQFQFDAPPQENALFTSGFSVCDGNILALGGNQTFYRCLSGDFFNLYNVDWADQCEPVSIIALPCGSSDTVSQIGDGQVVGTTVVQTTIVTALPDGQPQVVTTQVPVPVTSYYPTSVKVSQISDGQVQAPPPVTATTVATGSAPVVTTATTAAGTAGTTAVPASPSVSGSASIPVVSSSSSSPATGSSSSAAAGTTAAPSASTTAAPSSGSSRMAGSLVALVAPLLIAIVYL